MPTTDKWVIRIENMTDPLLKDFMQFQFTIEFSLDDETLESLKNVTISRSEFNQNDYIQAEIKCYTDFSDIPPP